MDSQKDFDQKLKDTIEKTGFQVELEIASKLENLEWLVIDNAYFYDDDKKKQREIDIHAFHNPTCSEMSYLKPIPFCPNLVCECKTSRDYAWVFFNRTSRPRLLEGLSIHGIISEGQIYDIPRLLSKDLGKTSPLEAIVRSTPLHYSSFDRIASTYVEAKPKSVKSDRSDKLTKSNRIADAIYKTIKAWIYYEQTSLDSAIKAVHRYFPIEVAFLVIVLDGRLYEASVNGEEIELRRTDHLLLKKSYRSLYSNREADYSIDIVTRGFFNNYLELVNKDIRLLKMRFRKRINELQRYLKKSDVKWYQRLRKSQ